MKKIKLLLLLALMTVVLSGDILDQVQKIDELKQQGKNDEAAQVAKDALKNPNLSNDEKESLNHIANTVAEPKTNNNQQGEQQTATTAPPKENNTPAPSAETTGTVNSSPGDDISDGSKYNTYDNYDSVITNDPNANKIFRMCNLYYRDGLYERAADLAKKDTSGDIRNLFVIAISARLSGDFDEAIIYYNEILAKMPNSSEAKLGLGISYKSKGEFSKAIGYLSDYLRGKSDPEVSRDLVVLNELVSASKN